MDSMHSQPKPHAILQRNRKNNFKMYTDVQKTLDRQGYYTKGIIIAYLTSYYRAVVMQNMVLVQKQTHMSIEQNRTLRRPDICP